MNINIYYGGRGLIDDPTLFVINKMQEILEELRVNVTRYNMYELKNTITTLPQTLKDADGIILATTVEWYGIGGYMQQFLDACWLFGNKEKMAEIYMCPVVMSTTYGEREAKLNLATAWEILGGLPCSGICGYIENTVMLEMNEEYIRIIEKKAENMYRTINQHMASFPASNQAVKQRIAVLKTTDLTPQESEQLSRYVSDDTYVKQQKEDIEELASMFKDMLGKPDDDMDTPFVKELESHFVSTEDFAASYSFIIEGIKKPLYVAIQNGELEIHYGQEEKIDVVAKLSRDVLQSIIDGRMTFQRAFMTGEMTAKGNFKTLRMLDQIFVF